MLATKRDLRTLPEAFTDEWASEMARAALLYLSQCYVAGADLTVLEPWEDRVTAAAVEGDARAYREAMRGYIKAGLRAFDEARRVSPHEREHNTRTRAFAPNGPVASDRGGAE